MILARFRVTDRVAVITGAGRGIGAATAVAPAEAGADVVLAARTETDLRAVADRVTAAGRSALVVPADLSDPAAAATVSARAIEEFRAT
jgi:7-alpha-hydroxysteroid dehydrogenase